MDASAEEVAALADQLSQLAKGISSAADPTSKKHQTAALVMQAKKMIWQIQDPFDALMDHVVNGYTIGAAAALCEIGVFEAVPMEGTAKLKDIAQRCDADEELITRLMRQLTCVDMFTEVAVGEWAHNKRSIGMSEHVGMNGKYFFKVAMEEMLPSMITFNQYLRKFGAHSVLLTYTNTPHSWYNQKLGSNFWEVLSSSPDRLDTFSRGLSMFAALHPVVAMFPFATALQAGNAADRVLAVDIGGGRGMAMLELRKNCPNLQGELILQDRAVVLDSITAEDLPGVTKMEHDFFTPQPVRGAQIYYIRRVMHDWQDSDAVRILKSVVPAMAKDSRVLLSDFEMPEPVTPRDAGGVWMDLMMLSIGGKERTRGNWAKLGERSGLKLVKVWQEPERYGPLCVVEYMLPDAEEKGAVGAAAAPMASSMTKTTEPAEHTEQRDVDWEERTVVGDREQSVEPSAGA